MHRTARQSGGAKYEDSNSATQTHLGRRPGRLLGVRRSGLRSDRHFPGSEILVIAPVRCHRVDGAVLVAGLDDDVVLPSKTIRHGRRRALLVLALHPRVADPRRDPRITASGSAEHWQSR
jgi:hypothetical protein